MNIKRFMLMYCCERDMENPMFFDTQEQAYEFMCGELAEVKGMTIEEIMNLRYDDDYEGDIGITETTAWTERFGNNHDWKIFDLEEVGAEE